MDSSASLAFIFPKRTESSEGRKTLSPGSRPLEFMENEEVRVENTGSIPARIECAFALAANGRTPIYPEEDGFVTVKPGETLQISVPAEDAYYIPGNYEVRWEGIPDTARFAVTQLKNMSSGGMENIVRSLEKVADNLTSNTARSIPSIKATERILSGISENLDTFSYSILSSPDGKFESSVERVSVPKRQNARSIRMNLTRGAASGRSYGSVRRFTFDTEANRRLKLNIYRGLAQIRSIDTYIRLSLESDTISEKSPSYQEMNHLLSLIVSIDRILLNLYRAPFLRNVPLSIEGLKSDSHLSRPDYRFIENATYSLYHPESNDTSTERKSSSVLFEMYGYVIIDSALKRDGFNLVPEECEGQNIFEPMHTRFVYRRRTVRAKIEYGPKASKLKRESPRADSLVSVNSEHNNPDFALEFTDAERGFLGAIVVEMKYRNQRSVVANPESKLKEDDRGWKVMNSLLDYFQLAYIDRDGNLIKGAVDSVYLLYPSEEESVSSMLWDIGSYIGVNPERPLPQQAAVKELSQRIERLIGGTQLKGPDQSANTGDTEEAPEDI